MRKSISDFNFYTIQRNLICNVNYLLTKRYRLISWTL